MAKRIFSQVRREGSPVEEDDGTSDLLASKMLLSLASAPVVHSDQDEESCAISVSTMGSRSGRPESTRSGGADSKCFDSGDEDDEEDHGIMSDERSRSSSPVSSDDDDGERKRSRGLRTAKSITLDELRLYFDKPIEEAAKIIGICSTLLKKICRRYNIKRWPYRQIKSLDRTIDCLKLAAQNARAAEQERFNSQIRLLESRRTELIETPTFSGQKRAAASNELAGAELIADITSLQRRAVSLGKPLQHRKAPSDSSSSPSTTPSSTTPSLASPPSGPAPHPPMAAAPPNPWLLQPVHPALATAFAVALQQQQHHQQQHHQQQQQQQQQQQLQQQQQAAQAQGPPPPAAAAAPPPPHTLAGFCPPGLMGSPLMAAGLTPEQQQHHQQALMMQKMMAAQMMAGMPVPHTHPLFLGFMPPAHPLPAAMGPAAMAMAIDPAQCHMFERALAYHQRLASSSSSTGGGL